MPTSLDGPRLPPKTGSLPRSRGSDSPVIRPRPTSRDLGLPQPNRSSNGAKLPVNGMSSSNNVHMHNAYYPVTVSPVNQQPPPPAKWSSQPRGSSPQVLLSTGAEPKGGGTPGVIACPLQPGASLTRPPLKRDLLINDSRKPVDPHHSGSGGKCCVIM